jgi:hypothetical protein
MDGTPPAKRSWTDGNVACVVVAVAAFLAFAPSLSGGWVWDDTRFITGNPSVTKPDSWLRFLTDPSTVDAIGARGIVRPLRTLEFALDYAVFGDSPLAFRLHSLAWHAAAAVLLLQVLRRLVGDGRAALAGALFWAVHPAQAESVAVASSRGDVAMGACVLASILFALRSQGYDRDFAASLAFAAVAALYKETAVALPGVVIALRWLRLARVAVWPYVVVAAAYVVYRQRVVIGPMDNGLGTVLGGSVVGTFATMSRGAGFYAAESLLPAFSFDWYMVPSRSFADAAALAWLGVLVALAASAVVFRRTAPLWTIAVAWFLAFLAPVANWPFFLGIPTAERFLYVPLAGVAIAVAWIVARGPRRLFVPVFVVVAALAAQAASRSRLWRTEDELWTAVAADHASPRALDTRAKDLRADAATLRDAAVRMPQGAERTAAMAHAKELLESSLDFAHRAIDLWCVFEGTARPRTQLLHRPENTASNACYILGRDAEALFHADEANRVDELSGTPSWYGHYNRAMPLLQLGFVPQAMSAMRRARELGMTEKTSEIGEFFLSGADACRRANLPATARAAYASAADAAPDGPLRRAAEAGLDALRSAVEPDAAERALLANNEQAFARLARSCPALRPLAGKP